MAFSQGGYPGPYPQHDARYAMHAYDASVPPQAALYPDQGYWQAPHAPRLTAAAARAGRLPSLAHGHYAYPLMNGQTPWHPQVAPLPHHYLQQHHQQQPRTHQQLEHQLLMQHQMAKGSSRQGPYEQPRHSSRPQSRGYEEQAWYPSGYAYNRSRTQSHRDSWDGSQAAEYDVPQQTGRDWRDHGSSWSQWQQQAHRNSVPHLNYASQYHPQQYQGHRASWASADHVPDQWHGRAQTQPLYPVVNDPRAYPASSYAAQPVPVQAREHADMLQQQYVHQQEQAAHGLQEVRPSPELWQPRPETRRLDPQQDDAVPKEAAAKAEQAAANTEQVPAPPSPDTLDNSAVPIAAIGAQLIWNACTALFDPELLTDAHDVPADDEDMDEDTDEHPSPTHISAPSSDSTPSINTPDMSPWASTVLEKPANADGDWNSFRSPFGPKLSSDATKPVSGHGRVGSDTSFSNDLHRMAVGAERAGRPSHDGSRRQASGADSDCAAAHSSGASTASSSEPGTPVSVDQSPTLTAHSNDARRSFRGGSAMSVDRSPSKASMVSPKSSSKGSDSTASSRWSSRMRDNVLAVLRLVSPEWKWSNNDHQLVSLAVSPAAPNKAGGRGRESVTGVVTSYANEPSPAFRRFAHQVLAQTLLSPTAYLLGILNALRVPLMARLPDGSIDPTVMDLFAQPTSAAPFKLLTLGLMIANKHLDDNTFLNKTWNEVTGIPLLELNQMEAWFLKKCNYEVTVPDDTWASFLHKLQSWEEKRSSFGAHRDQDCAKRLLIILDEAVSHFDVIPNFRLDHAQHAAEPESPTFGRQFAPASDSWGRCYTRPTVAALGAHHPQSRSTPAIGTFSSKDRDDELALDHASTLLRSRSDYAASSSSKTISPMSDAGKSQIGTMSGPLMPSTLLNGSRALLHGSAFAPLATPS